MDKNTNLNKQINAFEEYYLRAQKEEIRKIINNEVYEVLCGNGTPEQAKENISEAFHSLTSLVKNVMLTIASYHMISAQIDVLKKWGIKEYQIVAEQDLRTCIKCRSMSGRHFKVEECKVMGAAPPFHFNCRCKIIPYRLENDIRSFKQNINLLAISKEEETQQENEMEPLEIPWGTKKDNSQITYLGGTSIQNVPENIFRKIASMGIGFIPVVGDIKDIQEVLTGYDIVAGEKLTWVDRGITLACVFLPIVNGKAVREGLGLVDEGIEIAKGIRKNMDEGIEAISKHADEAAQGVGSKTGKFIDNTTDAITKSERQVVDNLVGQGKTVERIPANPKVKGGTPDFKVDGVNTELKTLQNANTNTGMKRIQDGFNQGAKTVIIDARGAGLTSSQASEMISRAIGKYPNGQIPGNVEIWIDGQVITYP